MLHLFSTDRDWEIMARGEPFWAVSTWEKFRKQNLTPENLKEFFETGETYVDSLFRMIRDKIDPKFAPARSLDFGCGVGRVLLPIARRSGQAVGVDISDTMLNEARQQADAFGVQNLQLIKGDDTLSSIEGPFDFVHSVIVFQHIPVPRGEAIFAELLKRMHNGSVGAIHFTYAKGFEPARPTLGLRWRRFWKRIGNAIASLRGNPVMQMNDYSLNVLFRMIQEHGIKRTNVSFFDHDRYYGVLLLFQVRNDDHASL
jgi:SAM-dependent methyltransferase